MKFPSLFFFPIVLTILSLSQSNAITQIFQEMYSNHNNQPTKRKKERRRKKKEEEEGRRRREKQ